jgi:hypothetical protein
MLLDMKSILKIMSTCEKGFQKKKKLCLLGIEPAASDVDDSTTQRQTIRGRID